jgi:hypothetical protein
MTADEQDAAANGNTFFLTFRGAPLTKTDITVFGPPKAGGYILNAVFTELVARIGFIGERFSTNFGTLNPIPRVLGKSLRSAYWLPAMFA